jgi:hypothetical protein
VNKQRVSFEAVIACGVTRGMLTASSGERREFHGWLELNTGLEGDARPRP